MTTLMQRLCVLTLLAGFILLPAAHAASRSDSAEDNQRVLVGFDNRIGSAPMQRTALPLPEGVSDTALVATCDHLTIQEFSVDDVDRFVTDLASRKNVAFIEPDYPVSACSPAPYVPDDPMYAYQWSLEIIGADDAWSMEQGNSNITIAIVDTGIDYRHADLAGNYRSGGYDWVNDDADPLDDNGHGTHCAGIAAAVMDNDRGIAGVAQVGIMAEKVLNAQGGGYISNVAKGIIHAADSGADIISLSLGGEYFSQTQKEACDYAWSKGCIIVAASGNGGGAEILYPAAYDSVIAIGSIGKTSALSSFSNQGSAQELVAPGERILATLPGDTYGYMSGTSMACPHVAGVAALVLSRYPAMTNENVRTVLAGTADDLGQDGRDSSYGFGRVDAEEAVWASPTSFTIETRPVPAVISASMGGSPGWGEAMTITLTAENAWIVSNATIDLSDVGGSAASPMTNTGDGVWSTDVSAALPSPFMNGTYQSRNLVVTITTIRGTVNTTTIPVTVIRNGDVNEDGTVTIADAAYLARHLLGVPGYENMTKPAGDVSGDGRITMYDALFIARHITGQQEFAELR
ncbi:hypothetical protein FGU65_05240 [Methanoculleus sp. FWC-SCC1]|uniref:Dockerin domain-containing protein n=1 Tax=Methanoculleus frigidifontis TaxID=2584085 RepID=A0ABT8M8Q8_9EURY|nr:S8 family serine peptidase [Methanoculleus sp. FWC-SCC1]MDN7024301.1 hypothetical protein [Methanoculleus sp. FWC-SCC1]